MAIKHAKSYLLPRRRQLSGGLELERRSNEHFLEAIAVIAIVAILLGVATKSYRAAVDKAMLVEAASVVVTFRSYATEYFAITGRLPEVIQTSDGPPNFASRYFEDMNWIDDEIVFDVNRDIVNRFSGDTDPVAEDAAVPTLSFRVARAAETGRQIFLCGYADPPDGFFAEETRHTSISEQFLPSFCRS